MTDMQCPIYKLSQLRFHARLGDGVPEMRFERMIMGPTSRDIQGPKVQGGFVSIWQDSTLRPSDS